MAVQAVLETAEECQMKEMLFALGQIVMTPGALQLMEDIKAAPVHYIRRHVTGDWGDLDESDKKENDLSVKAGFRILSAYNTPCGKLWIITESDRSVTTLLLPDEY
jgi:hypothetical protein